jgi:VanZ family protein
MHHTAPAGMQNRKRAFSLLTLLYVAMIVYGSLYPFSGWRAAIEPRFSFLTDPFPYHISGADVLTNILAYLPLGILLVWTLETRSRMLSLMCAVMLGGVLSFTMESVQMFLPSRVSSNVDLLTNLAGTLIGGALGLAFHPKSEFSLWLKTIRDEWFLPGPGSGVVIATFALWILSQLSPFVPSMDVSSIAQGLAPIWRPQSAFSLLKVASYAMNVAGIGLMMAVVGRSERRIKSAFVFCVMLMLLLKPFIVTRQLSREALFGLVCAGLLLSILPNRKPLQVLLAMLFIFGGFIVAELTPAGDSFHPFNWIPFAGQIDDTVGGFGSILDGVWPFVALAGLTILGFGVRRKPMLWSGGVLLIGVFALEWMQQSVPGRYGDVTVLVLAAIGWTVPWLFVSVRGEKSVDHRVRRIRHRAVDL